MGACPSFDTLRCLGASEVDETVFIALEDHVESCATCRARLDDLLHHGTLGDPTLRISGRLEATPPKVPGYLVERVLGRGGVGVVYLATRQGRGGQVALKVIGAGPIARPFWRREARTLAKLDRPDVVRLFEVVEGDGWVCLVLEYVPGGTLEARLAAASPPPRDVARIVEITARAVSAIHEAGLLHLDLKPSNILIPDPADAPLSTVRPKVADFGLALGRDAVADSWTVHAGPRGTPSFMAPEQLTNDRLTTDTAADIFALGAVLYWALTGRPPFRAEDREATYRQLRDSDPIPPRRLNPAVPRDLETICLACLEKAPGRRYATAEALADDLRRFLEGRPILRRPAPKLAVARRWCYRNPAPAGLALVAVATPLLLIALFDHRARDARAERDRAVADRARVVTNLRLSSRALLHLNWMTDQTLSDLSDPDRMDPREVEALLGQLEDVFPPLVDASASGAIDEANLLNLGVLSVAYADRLRYAGRDERQIKEVMAVARSSLRISHRRHPDLEVCRWMLVRILAESAHRAAFESGERLEAAIAYAREADELFGSLPTTPYLLDSLARLADAQRLIADALIDRGCRLDAKPFFRSSARSLGQLHQRSLLDPIGQARYARVLACLGRQRAAVEVMRSLSAPIDPATPIAMEHRDAITGWILRRGGPLDLLLERDSSAGLPTGDEIHRLVLGEIEPIVLDADRSASGSVPFLELLDALGERFFERLSTQRARRRRDGAARTAACFLRLAESLAERAPLAPEAHRMVAVATIQHAKNAWMTEDYPEIRYWTERSLDAIRRAAALDPEDAFTERLLRKRERQLAELPAA